MEKKFAEIINEGKATGKTIETNNKEMKEGFIPAATEPADVKHLHDYMRYDVTKAGQTVRVETPEGTYNITWDEGGHPEKAVRV